MNPHIVTQAKEELQIRHGKGKTENHTEFRKIALLTSWGINSHATLFFCKNSFYCSQTTTYQPNAPKIQARKR